MALPQPRASKAKEAARRYLAYKDDLGIQVQAALVLFKAGDKLPAKKPSVVSCARPTIPT